MRRNLCLLVATVILASGAGVNSGLGQYSYTISSIGTGVTTSGGVGRAVNESGQVAGADFFMVEGEGAVRLAYYYDGDDGMSLGRLGATGASYAYDINSSGQVVGYSWQDSLGVNRAFVYSGDSMVEIGPANGMYSGARALNDGGVVVGQAWFVPELSAVQAFRYENGNFSSLGTLGGENSSAEDINGNGLIVGSAQIADGSYRAFRYENGVMTGLGALEGGTNSYASGVNADGSMVVGRADVDGEGNFHAVVYTSAGVENLGTLGGARSAAYAINQDGVIVGYSLVDGTGDFNAMIYLDGQMVNLNTLVNLTGSGFVRLSIAYDINGSGQIVGQGELAGGGSGIFLLSPLAAVPEPAHLAFWLAGGMLGFVLWRRTSR